MSNKIVCVGRNYPEHALELNNDVPIEPIIFIKPWCNLVPLDGVIVIPRGKGEVHHELEIAIEIGVELSNATNTEAKSSISRIGLGLDLTLRNLQTQLKSEGKPWTLAKVFDGACPLSFIDLSLTDNLNLSNISINFV